MKKYILITAAMMEEAEYIINRLKNISRTKIGFKRVISGNLNNLSVKVLITGPCIVNAVQGVTAVVEKSMPSSIIQMGCGGGFKKSGLKIGDICVASEEIDVQLGIESEEDIFLPRQLPFYLYNHGRQIITSVYPVDSALSERAVDILKKEFFDDTAVMTGRFITVSTITATDERADRFFEILKPCIENMEGAGTAYVAMVYGIPFIEVRAVSNMIGRRNREEWDVKTAFERNGRAVYELVKSF